MIWKEFLIEFELINIHLHASMEIYIIEIGHCYSFKFTCGLPY